MSSTRTQPAEADFVAAALSAGLWRWRTRSGHRRTSPPQGGCILTRIVRTLCRSAVFVVAAATPRRGCILRGEQDVVPRAVAGFQPPAMTRSSSPSPSTGDSLHRDLPFYSKQTQKRWLWRKSRATALCCLSAHAPPERCRDERRDQGAGDGEGDRAESEPDALAEADVVDDGDALGADAAADEARDEGDEGDE